MLSANLSQPARAASAPPDPILAAIADHRRLWAEYCAAVNDVEEAARASTQTKVMITKRNRLEKAEKRALAALGKVRPTTLEGVGALVDYVREDMKDFDAQSWYLAALANVVIALTVRS